MIRAQMADGTVLEFPDGTPDAVVDKAAKDYLAEAMPSGAAALSKAEGISATPEFQKPLRTPAIGALGVGIPSVDLPSMESVAEALPAVGGTVGALLGNVPGATLGGTFGEALRQLIRRGVGQPAATGLIQRAAGLDPNSAGAALAGLGAEAVVGPAAEAAAGVGRAAQRGLERGAKRSLGNLLQPASPVDKEAVLDLATRMETEKIAPAFSSRGAQLEKAQGLLAEARANRAAIEAKLAGQPVPATAVLDRSLEAIPKKITGTDIVPKSGKAQRSAANKAAEDVATTLEAHGGTGTVPFEVAQAEKRRWDEMLKSFYEGGRDTVPQGVQYTKKAADAWRAAIAKEFPEMGAANLRESELIDVTRLLDEALKRIHREGPVGAASEAAALGAGAVGRTSIPAMVAAKVLMGAGAGPISSTSNVAKRALAKLLVAPTETAQTWMRMADFFNNPQPPQEPKNEPGN